MRRAARAAVLAASALVVGGIAASDVADREAALRRALGPPVPVVVARAAISRGEMIAARRLALRHVPERYAPRVAFAAAAQVIGARAAADIAPGTDLVPALLAGGGTGGGDAIQVLAPGQRLVRIVAIGSPAEIAPGALVDVLATRAGRGDGTSTHLALRGVRVIEAQAAGEAGGDGVLPHVVLALRATVRQALELARTQADGSELQVLVRPVPVPGS